MSFSFSSTLIGWSSEDSPQTYVVLISSFPSHLFFNVSLPIMGCVCFKLLSSIIVFEACNLCCAFVRSMVRIKYFILLMKSTWAKIKLCGYPQLVFFIQSKISWLSGISKEEINLVLHLLICCLFLSWILHLHVGMFLCLHLQYKITIWWWCLWMESYIAYWFVVHKGLWNEGRQVQSLTKAWCVSWRNQWFLWPKALQEWVGIQWQVDPEEVAQIKDLYPKITDRSMAQNGPLMNQFATTIIT